MIFLDPDKTHDILFAQKIKGQILNLLKTAISTRGIFDNPFPIALIEREAPGALLPWAEDWSGQMFEFLKPLSRTFILDDGFINGSAYGFTPEYTANLPPSIDLDDYKTATITVRVAPKKEGIITWLERTHDEQSAPYCDKLTNQITIAMRRSRLIRNQGNQSLDVEISTRNWLHNSVCFADCELVGLSAEQAQFFLYDQMQSFLDYLMGELDISECKVLTGMTVNTLCQARIFPQTMGVYTSMDYSTNETVNSHAEFGDLIGSYYFYSNPVFSVVPSSYCNASLYYPDGSRLGAKIVIRTSPVSISYNHSGHYSRYNYDNPSNTRLYHEVFPQLDNIDLFKFNYGQISVESKNDVTSYEYVKSIDPAIPNIYQEVELSSYKYFTGFQNGSLINLISESNLDINNFAYILSGERFTLSQARGGSVSPLTTTVVNGTTLNYTPQSTSEIYKITSYARQFSLPPSADYNLFSSGEIAWIYNGFASKEIINYQQDGFFFLTTGKIGYYNPYGNISVESKLSAINGTTKFVIDASDPYFLGVNTIVSPFVETVIQEDEMNAPFYSAGGSFPGFFPMFQEIRQNDFSVSLSRNLRNSQIPEIIIQY